MIRLTLFFLIAIFLSIIFFNEGCNVLKPAPTPTAIPIATHVPTSTPTPEPTKDPKAFLIIPGKGISDLQINKSTLDDVKKILGEPNTPPVKEQGNIKLVYEDNKLTFWFTPDKNILRGIWIQNDSYKTSEGIGIGSNLMNAQNTYNNGTLDKDKKIYYSNDGMDYYYDAGIITSIFLSDREPLAQTQKNTLVSTQPPTIPQIPSEYISSACKAVDALQVVQSMTKAGINYENYINRKVDTQVAVDQFINNNTVEYIPGLKDNIEKAMKNYNKAGECWSNSFSNKQSSFCKQEWSNLVNKKWLDADLNVNEASRLLNAARQNK